jgi:hypothetical protein
VTPLFRVGGLRDDRSCLDWLSSLPSLAHPMTAPTPRLERPYSCSIQHTERLPFSVRLVQSTHDLERAVAIRQQAYGRHMPELAQRLAVPEADDLRPDAHILIAESRTDGQVLGSVRLLSNLNRPLQIEQEVRLPDRLRHQHVLEARRLAIQSGPPGRQVTPALVKAAYEISYRCGLDFVLATARRPVDKMYQAMQFEDLLKGQQITQAESPDLPLSIYGMDIPQADALWIRAQCPLYGFMAQTYHPDIDIDFTRAHQRFNHPQHLPDTAQPQNASA